MSKDHESRYQAARRRIETQRNELVNPEDADNILRCIDCYDPENLAHQAPAGQKEKARTTLYNYATYLRRVAKEVSLTESTATELNEALQSFYDGSSEYVKDDGLSKNTVRSYQNGVRQFLYAIEGEAEAERIVLTTPETDTVDPEDMLTREEIQAIRAEAACLRDLALFDFLLYTGQRNTATRTIRIKDLDLDNGRFKLNEEAEGLKGADNNGKWRDLLLAEATVRQYLKTEHPTPNEPDHYLFTGRPKYSILDASEPIGDSTIGRPLRKMADRAAEKMPSIAEKPTHPHALRHNFVTIALRRGMKEPTIKQQIGHSPDSNVMESTYAHLSDSDHIREARRAFGKETDEPESELTPEVCPTCGASTPNNARLCGVCGLEFTPDAKELSQEMDKAFYETKGQAAKDGNEKAEEGADVAKELLDENPELRDAIMGLVKDELRRDDDEPAGAAATLD